MRFYRLKKDDHELVQLITTWYASEWNIPAERTAVMLASVKENGFPFFIVLYAGEVPIGVGGLSNDVGLLVEHPRFKVYSPWVTTLYTVPEERRKGYGALLCEKIEQEARKAGLETIYLNTDTAERLYTRLGWEKMETVSYREGSTLVMKKDLTPNPSP